MYETLDGSETDPVAICGLSFKFPQDASSSDAFWHIMEERRCTMTEFPAGRLNIDAFHGTTRRLNTFSNSGGHFIHEDLSLFDADFFAIPPAEAAQMDPMQRWLLETAFRAIENAGVTLESISGTNTGVYTGCFTNDYLIQLSRDAECMPTYMATGIGASMLANRISWFFNLQGPSVAVDSACSSSATALDLACQALKSGACKMGVVAGCNLTYSPEYFKMMSNMNFLSPDSRCYSFDHRANGYARGEGISVIILKKLSDAIRDGNCIRAIIRATGCNEDGRTPGITQPSSQAQERLIRETYRKAGLSMRHTRLFEAHGTGTPIGDPLEARAIGQSFKEFRSPSDPLFVGAVKSNIGHLEGASALAGVIKTVLVLEKGVIPPNANFEKLNPSIDATAMNLKFPNRCYDWPSSGLRRASINSFGYGGSNCHIILDDAYHYMLRRGLEGRHNTTALPRRKSYETGRPPRKLNQDIWTSDPTPNYVHKLKDGFEGEKTSTCIVPLVGEINQRTPCSDMTASTGGRHQQWPRLLVFSAADKSGIDRISESYKQYFSKRTEKIADDQFLGDLACTLDSHRSHLAWRSFAVPQSSMDLGNFQSLLSSPTPIRSDQPKIGLVFTGQGAQWAGMGRELMAYDIFRERVQQADAYLKLLGCTWSATEELLRQTKDSRLDDPQYSQTLCTILQIAIVDLLRSVGVHAHGVVGHSSGEIAAAYAGYYISAESAWSLSYLRGVCSSELTAKSGDNAFESQGAMMAVGLSESDVRPFITKLNDERRSFGISIACINSPKSVTVAGERHLVDNMKAHLEDLKVFCRKLRVKVAYHSRQMATAAAAYESLIGDLTEPVNLPSDHKPALMISSVTGQYVSRERLLQASYWAENLSAPVRFFQAISTLRKQMTGQLEDADLYQSSGDQVDQLLEVGPAAALQGPLREIFNSGPGEDSLSYSSVLRRGESAQTSFLRAMGELHCRGSPLDLRRMNEPTGTSTSSSGRQLIVDLPEYPFDHSKGYWYESRKSRNYRFRSKPVSHFLGVRCDDWTRSEPSWRHFLRTSEMPWTADHVINGGVTFPAAGMLVMAIEAIKDIHQEDDKESSINAFQLRDVDIRAAISLNDSHNGVEVKTTLCPRFESVHGAEVCYAFTIRSFHEQTHDWVLNCQGTISTETSELLDDWTRTQAESLRTRLSDRFFGLPSHRSGIEVSAESMYKYLKEYGFEFGPYFQKAQNQTYYERERISTAEVELLGPAGQSQVVIHPASLDTFFHLALTTLTSGGSQPIDTAVPTHIGGLWIANMAFGCTKSVNVGAAVDQVTQRGCTCSGAAVDSTSVSKEVVVFYEDLRMTNVASHHTLYRTEAEQFCMCIQCKPALKHMMLDDVAVMLEKEYPSPEVDHEFWRDIELLCDLAIDDLVASVGNTHSEYQSWKPWRRCYWNWAQHRIDTRPPTQHPRLCDANADGAFGLRAELESRLNKENMTGKLFVTVASNLLNLFHELVSPLEILMQSGILGEFYEQTNEHSTTSQITRYVDLLAHQQPGLKLFEIGGGTGGGTRNFIRGLSAGATGEHPASLRCARYDFTDVSPTLVSAAKLEFEEYQPQMTFGTLDIEQSFTEQGFAEGEYDIVLAVNVLHITRNLRKALRRARRSLKVGGKLIFKESLSKDGWAEGFVFGLFPGWWFGVDDGRSLSPSLDLESWNRLLRETGFSQCELVLKVLDGTPSPGGWMVATATDETDVLEHLNSPVRGQVRIIIDGESDLQREIAQGLSNSFQCSSGIPAEILAIQTLSTAPQSQGIDTPSQSQITILLAVYQHNYLGQLNELTWDRLRTAITSYRNQLWISSGGGRNSPPDHGFLDGLARTLRHEQPDRQVVLLSWEEADCMEDKLKQAVKVAREMMSRVPGAHYEQDYIAMGGLLHTRRLVEAPDLRASIEERAVDSTMTAIPCDGKVELKMSHDFGGVGHRLQFEQLASSSTTLGAGEIEILVRALALRPRRDETKSNAPGVSLSWDHCAGEVLRAASDTGFHPGDRVFATFTGQTYSHLVISAEWAIRIPDGLAFPDACLLIPSKISAFHASLTIGRVKPGDQVLVHNGASPAGHCILEALVSLGCTSIWATAANLRQSERLESDFQIRTDHIVPSAWLEGDSLLLSELKSQFDLVLMAGSPHKTQKTGLSLIKPGGRIVMLRSLSDDCKGNLTFLKCTLPPNATLSVVETSGISPSRAVMGYVTGKLPTTVGQHDIYGKAVCVTSLANVRADEPVVVTFEDSAIVHVEMAREAQGCVGGMTRSTALHSEASYVVAGGLGGLGCVTARWLARHGARYLILLSRSGPIRRKAKELLSELEQMGVCVETPCCDISSEASLTSTLASLSARMPPIRGCIQASMVLKESFLHQTSFQEWEAATAPKGRGSWNLHRLLPQKLDFFLLLASSMGIIGTQKLVGYNAGTTYQAALARYRRSLGLAAVCIDLGGVLDEGYVAEKEFEKGFFKRNQHLIPISIDHFHALLETYCLQPGNERALAEADPEMIIGLSPPAYWTHKVGMVPFTMAQPFWGHMHHLPVPARVGDAVDDTSAALSEHRKHVLHEARRLAGISDCAPERAAGAVSEALGEQVSRLLGAKNKPLEDDRPLQQIGIDSLSAIDLRDWVRKVFDVELSVFELLDGSSLRHVGLCIVSKTRSRDERANSAV